MRPEAIIRSTLINDSEVSAIVGEKSYIDEIPESASPPFIVFQRDSTEPQNTIHGTQIGEFVVLSIVAQSKQRNEADTIAEKVEAAMRASDFWKVTQESAFDEDKKLHIAALQYRYFHS